MTNKQNDDNKQFNESASEINLQSDETDFVKSSEDRPPVKFDDRTTFDELDDYIFLRQKRKKKKAKHQILSDNISKDNRYADYPVMQSRTHSHKKKSKSHKKNKMKTWKKIVIAVISTILAIVLLMISTVAVLFYRGGQQLITDDFAITVPDDIQSQNHGEYIVYKGNTYKINDKMTSILLMGVDTQDIKTTTVNGSGGQADFILLMAIDTSTGKTTLINISRDTMTDITLYSAGGAYVGTEKAQLCLAYAYGNGKETSCENQVSAVQKLFYNIPIESYFSFHQKGIAVINDSIGGVDVVSPETVERFVEGQSYHLMGEDAFEFVHMRNQETLDANNGRMARQQTYINAFISKVLELTKQDITTPINLFNAASEYSCTNLNASKISYLAATTIKNGGMSYDLVSVPGEVKMGKEYAEFYVDEDKFFEQFLNIYYTPMN